MNRVIIDVREPNEYAASHVPGALNAPLSQLAVAADPLPGVPKDADIVVYCQSGNRSAQAIKVLAAHGYSQLTNGISQAEVLKNYQ